MSLSSILFLFLTHLGVGIALWFTTANPFLAGMSRPAAPQRGL